MNHPPRPPSQCSDWPEWVLDQRMPGPYPFHSGHAVLTDISQMYPNPMTGEDGSSLPFFPQVNHTQSH